MLPRGAHLPAASRPRRPRGPCRPRPRRSQGQSKDAGALHAPQWTVGGGAGPPLTARPPFHSARRREEEGRCEAFISDGLSRDCCRPEGQEEED